LIAYIPFDSILILRIPISLVKNTDALTSILEVSQLLLFSIR
jgi:hypothetical protein